MSDDNEVSHSDSSSSSSSDNKQAESSERLDVDHMYSDQSQDGQTRSRTTVIRDIVKVIISRSSAYVFCVCALGASTAAITRCILDWTCVG